MRAAEIAVVLERNIMGSKLWRYTTIEQFLNLLVTKSLWFTRVDQFPDKNEGLYPARYYNVDFIEQQYRSGPRKRWPKGTVHVGKPSRLFLDIN